MKIHLFTLGRGPSSAAMAVVVGACCTPAVLGAWPGAHAPAQPAVGAPERPDTVVANVRRALGIETLKSHPAGVQLDGDCRMLGTDGSFSLVFDARGDFLHRVSGPISMTNGFDGTRTWADDLGGERRITECGDRERAIVNAAILSGRAFAPDSPLDYALAPGAEGAPADAARLAFRLRDGLVHGTVEIDRTTWLPRKWTLDSDVVTQTFALSGVVEFSGLKFPAKVENTASSGQVIATTIKHAGDAPAFVRSPYEPVLTPPMDVTFTPGVPGALEVKRVPSGHMMVHPTVGGQDLGWFIFDTGAGGNVLDTRAADKLGLERFGAAAATGAGGSVSTSFCRAPSLTLGPATIDKPFMTVMDLSFLDPFMGTPVMGIVGYGLLHRVVAEVDFKKGEVSIHDPASYELKGAEWQKLVLFNRILCVEGAFEDHKGLFRLDTGAGLGGAIIHTPAVERFKLLEGRPTVPAAHGGVGGMQRVQSGTLAWFELAGNRVENVPATFSTEHKGALADEYTLGTIGGALVQPFRIVLDYQHARIAFVKR